MARFTGVSRMMALRYGRVVWPDLEIVWCPLHQVYDSITRERSILTYRAVQREEQTKQRVSSQRIR